jgi:hypothetical protein
MKGIRNVVTSNTDDMVGIYFATGTTTTGTHWSGITGSRTDNATDWGTQLNFYTHDNSVAGLNLATQKMVIKGDGNVGIGTTSPGVKLTVVTPNVVNTAVNVLKLGDDTNGLVFKSYFDASGIAWRLNKGLAGINMVTLSQGGNVGIGTDSPSAKLDVNGDVFINSNYTGSNAAANDLTIGKTTTGDHGITIATGPTYTGSIYFGDSGNNDAGIIKYQHSNNSMQFVTNRSEAMRIDTSGNVMIGNTNASAKLDIRQDTGYAFRTENASGYTFRVEADTGNIEAAGNVLITAALLSNQENTDIDSAAAEVVAEVSTTYTAAFFDFVVKKGTNVRSGTVYACHDGTNVEYTETSTNDLGDTSDVTLSVDISGTNMRLLATVTSNDWSVKSLIRAI